MYNYVKMFSLALDIVEANKDIIKMLLDIIKGADVSISDDDVSFLKEKNEFVLKSISELRDLEQR